jgi:hypothetical protein
MRRVCVSLAPSWAIETCVVTGARVTRAKGFDTGLPRRDIPKQSCLEIAIKYLLHGGIKNNRIDLLYFLKNIMDSPNRADYNIKKVMDSP